MPETSNNTEVRIDGLAIAYGGAPVFEDFHLHVASGERVTVTGPSGSGKSSVLRALLGFVQPTAGTIAIGGAPLDAQIPWKDRNRATRGLDAAARTPGSASSASSVAAA